MKKYLLHTLFLFTLLLPVSSHAGGFTESFRGVIFDINTASVISNSDDPAKDTFAKRCARVSKPNRITGNVVRCADIAIDLGGDRIIGAFVKPFSAVVYYAVIVAVVLFGIQMMYGVARKDVTLMMVIKIVAVLFVCGPDGYMFLKNTRNVLIGFPKNISSSLVSNPGAKHNKMFPDPDHPGQYIVHMETVPDPNNSNNTITQPVQEHDITLIGFGLDILGIKNLLCKPDGTTMIGTACPAYRMEDLYDKFDESILRIFGVNETDIYSGQKNTEQFIGIAVLGMGLIFTGGWGALFAVELLLLATATLFAIAQMALFFIVVAIAINVLVAMAPIAMACMLFKSTQNITQRWFNYLFVYSLQPIVMVVFMIMVTTILEKVSAKYKEMNFYPKIDLNMQNTDGNPFSKMNVFDCFGATGSTDQANPADGAASASKGCDLSANVFTINNDGVNISPNTIQTKDLKDVTALNLAVIILQLILLSFIKQIPQMVARMANAGGMDRAAEIVTNPTDKFLPDASRKAGSLVGGALANRY